MPGEVCQDHSGFKVDIDILKRDVKYNKSSVDDICKKLDALKNWIMALLGSVVLSLALQVVRLLNGH